MQPVQHTDGITYTRCMTHMEITDESPGLAKPKAKPAKGPMRPEYDDVRMKPGLGLKQQPKQRQGLLTNMFKKKEPVAAHPEFGQVRMKPGLGEGQASAQGVETAIADCIAGCEETESDRNIGFLV